MDMKFSHTVSLILLGLGLQATASYADEAYFRTPSDNIYCAYGEYDGGPSIRCDIMSFTPTIGGMPADCDLEWGDAFEIGPGYGSGELLCHGDTVRSPGARTLAYGKAFRRNGLTCISEKTGLTCTNGRGHGFFLSKAEQRVF